jgi:signal transduction histidine kinase
MEDGILPVDETELATLSREAGRLARLIDDLQTMSALDSAAVRLETTTVDVVPLVADVIEARRGRAAARDVAVTTDGDPSALATVDPGRLAQVVGNLLDNAMEHAGAGRVTVEVGAGEAGGPVIIRVTDDGPGLDEVASKRAFDRMWRGDPARSGGGQGLGLPTARGLARAMGGDVSVAHAPTGGPASWSRCRRGLPRRGDRSPGPGPEHYAHAEGRRQSQSRPHARREGPPGRLRGVRCLGAPARRSPSSPTSASTPSSTAVRSRRASR